MIAWPSRRLLVLGLGLAALVALPPLAVALDQPYLISLGSRVLIYGLAALSLDLIVGYGGMVSFGHAAFVGLGAYCVGTLAHLHAAGAGTWPLPAAWGDHALVQWPIAMVVAALFALVIGALSLRTRGVSFIMITLAFAQMLYHLLVSLPAFGGQDGLSLRQRSRLPPIDLNDDAGFYYVVLALVLAALVVLGRLVDSRFGVVLRGAKDNEARLAALGVPTTRYKLTAFVIAGALAGLAGALAANQTEFVGPSMLHWTRSGELLVIVILGGMGTLYGALAGAATLLVLEEVLSGLTEHWMIVLGPILIAVVLFARRGVFGWLVGTGGRDG